MHKLQGIGIKLHVTRFIEDVLGFKFLSTHFHSDIYYLEVRSQGHKFSLTYYLLLLFSPLPTS